MSWSKLKALAACIRAGEVLILQGAPFIGVAFSIGTVTPSRLLAAVVFAAASFLLLAHIFTLNDWADFTRGVHQPDGAISRLEAEGITPAILLSFSLALVGASLLLFLFLSASCFLIAATITAFGFLYSHTSIDFKSIPIVSSLLHFLGGVLHFLLGYALFLPIDGRGLLIASFFALTFTAGHLNQEVRDFEVDQQVGARTNAVAFGKRNNFLVGFLLFVIAYGCLFLLAWKEIVPRTLMILPIIICPIHVILALRTLRFGLARDHIRRFQTQYRIIYFVLGLAILAALFWR